MFDKIIYSFKSFDSDLEAIINKFLKMYDPYKNPPSIAALMPIFLRVIFYLFVIIIPIFFIKILFPYKKWINILIYVIVFLAGLSVFGILLGFIQLLFTF